MVNDDDDTKLLYDGSYCLFKRYCMRSDELHAFILLLELEYKFNTKEFTFLYNFLSFPEQRLEK